MLRKRPLKAWSLLPLTLLAMGCGPKTDRLGISGQVNLDGAPLSEGSIRFTSGGDSPMAAGALIEEGSYSVPAEKGLLPGEYTVTIQSPDDNAPKIIYQGLPTAPDRIPSKYNVESTLKVQVTRGEENKFDFDIPSSKK